MQSERSLFEWIHSAGRICEKICMLEVKISRGWGRERVRWRLGDRMVERALIT